jgi:exodeoxyribonuclease V beta subunit
MSAIQGLDPLRMPLTGVRLIEASAGTGKTFTIAALYVRAILGHGVTPLMPPQILVVTFTDAATQELRERIRERLVDAARTFRGQKEGDDFLQSLLTDIPVEQHAAGARRLELAAEWMDEAAVFTIHGWSQRMLVQHAFGSGHPFEQTLEPQDGELFAECVRDYWRSTFYPLGAAALGGVLAQWRTPDELMRSLHPLLARGEAALRVNGVLLAAPDDLSGLLGDYDRWNARNEVLLADARALWLEAADELEAMLLSAIDGKLLNGNSYRRQAVDADLAVMRAWSAGGVAEANLVRFSQGKLIASTNKGKNTPTHAAFAAVDTVVGHAGSAPSLRHAILAHALDWVGQRFEQQKRRRAQMGYDDLLLRLDKALAGPAAITLAASVATQFPLAMIDEFQDTDALQYRIFRAIYARAATAVGLLLIGDPKQAIYAFRGADIHTYLGARDEAEAPSFSLDTNYRSSHALVEAVNALFEHGETHALGAFAFGAQGLPFAPVRSRGREDVFSIDGVAPAALQLVLLDDPEGPVGVRRYRTRMAEACADEIVRLLDAAADDRCGFEGRGPLQPRDIAILVRSRNEAEEIRTALRARKVRNVYLSDRDSIFDSAEAADVLFWLRACAEPTLDRRLRAALATTTLALPLAEVERLNTDERYWEERGRQFIDLRDLWRRQGVLAMLQRLLHIFELPARLLALDGGERALTNVLHVAELLQEAAANLDGEQALIRYLAEQLADPHTASPDEHIVRLESDADLVRVVTIHKSKGLEYPLVFVPFACSWKAASGGAGGYRFHGGEEGAQIELLSRSSDGAGEAVTHAHELAERARLQEDLRLLYVAVTRARHYCWLGVAPIAAGRARKPQVHHSGFGYLLSGGAEIDNGQFRPLLQQLAARSVHIVIRDVGEPVGEPLQALAPSELLDAARTDVPPPADRWWIASYSALRYDEEGHVPAAPDTAREDVVVEYVANQTQEPAVADSTLLPGFPRGAEAGTFLHDLFEWMAEEGFARTAAEPTALRDAIARRCQRRGWEAMIEPLAAGLPKLLALPLALPGDGNISLAGLGDGPHYRAELEFWFAADAVDTRELDRLVRMHTLEGAARAPLLAETVNGMFKGFIDLIFEHEGRWYVADYKSNWLGGQLHDYDQAAMTASILHSRYDLQYSIYLLALHRQLRARLGGEYDYDTHIGGAVYLYLRGIDGAGRGVFVERPPRVLIEAMDLLFTGGRDGR